MTETREAAERLRRGGASVHLIGICGVGMAGLAALLKARGFRVAGCDASPNRLADWLEARGISVCAGHSPDHVAPGVDWVIRSAAVPEDAAEIAAFRAAGKPVFRRGAVLPALLYGRTSIAVSGTHGKTTTTAFIAQVLTSAGRQPAFGIGGEVSVLGGVADAGRDEILVVEADESDGTAALYEPDIAVVTNIEFDHMEHFSSVEDFENCFRSLMRNARRRVVFCQDDPRAAALGRGLEKTLSYGFSRDAGVRGTDFREDSSGLSFAVFEGGTERGRISLPVRGYHNALNALAAAAVGLELGLTFREIREALRNVELPRRRFEKIIERDGVTVISDYAHHPTEVAALIRTARGLRPRRLRAVFQPHRYTRTLALGRDFPAAFAGVDELVLLPVYAASEKPLPGGSVWDLYRLFREQSRFAVSLASSLAHAWACFKRRLEPGDVFLVVGAGDVERIADWARAEIGAKGLEALSPVGDMRAAVARLSLVETALREMEPLAARTTLGVGGPADLWAEIGCESDLVRLLGWCRETGVPFHLVGAGSNLVVSDLGVAGVVGRLTGRVFHGVRREQTVLVAGGGVPLQRLLGYAEEQGLSGLEFLDGIPGTVGGAVRMNAGAWGEETGARVRRVRGVRPDGTEATLAAGELNFGYRSCRTLEGWIVLEVWLACGESTPGAVRERRAGFASRRAWMKGLRSAGSVFKNPLGQSAGQLLEAAGFKGYAVGGAMFSPLHANVITTRPGAQGSDVVALMQTARETVEARSGIRLEPEVVFLE